MILNAWCPCYRIPSSIFCARNSKMEGSLFKRRRESMTKNLQTKARLTLLRYSFPFEKKRSFGPSWERASGTWVTLRGVDRSCPAWGVLSWEPERITEHLEKCPSLEFQLSCELLTCLWATCCLQDDVRAQALQQPLTFLGLMRQHEKSKCMMVFSKGIDDHSCPSFCQEEVCTLIISFKQRSQILSGKHDSRE